MKDRRPVSFPPGTLRRWDRRVNQHPAADDQPNRVTFLGVRGPATREEILTFVAQNNTRYAREHPAE
jgi:hypothetical protein